MQCTYSKRIRLRCLLLSSRFKALGSSHSWSCLSCCFSWRFNTVTFSSGSSSLYTFTVQTVPFGPPPLMQRSRPSLVYKHPNLLPHTSYLLPLQSNHPLMFLAVFLYLLHALSPLTSSGFFNEMLEVFEPKALNFSILFRFILWILPVFRINLHSPFSPNFWILCSAF